MKKKSLLKEYIYEYKGFVQQFIGQLEQSYKKHDEVIKYQACNITQITKW